MRLVTRRTSSILALALSSVLGLAREARAVVQLEVTSCGFTDACPPGSSGSPSPGHADGNVDPGEEITLNLVLTNNGDQAATNVSVVVTSATPGVFIVQGASDFGTIAAGASAAGSPRIVYRTDAGVPCGATLQLDVAITSDQQSFLGVCRPAIPARCNVCGPVITISDCAIVSDRCSFLGPGHGDGLPDPGEKLSVKVTFRNEGIGDATSVAANFLPTAGVQYTVADTRVGDLPAGAATGGMPELEIELDPALPCGTALTLAALVVSDQATAPRECTLTVPVPCNRCHDGPLLVVSGCTWTDDCPLGGAGSGDGGVDPGEDASGTIRLENIGNAAATGVSVTITAPVGVVVTEGTSTYADIPAGGSSDNSSAITVRPQATWPCGQPIELVVTITTDQGTRTDRCVIPVPAGCIPCSATPLLGVSCGAVRDTCTAGSLGHLNGSLDPGEDGSFTMNVTNLGHSDASDVQLVVTSSTPGVSVRQGSASVGTVPALGQAAAAPTIDVSVGVLVPCGTSLVFDAAITSNQGDFLGACTIDVPLACFTCLSAVEDCENGVDDDGDGLEDCNDPGCSTHPGCFEADCGNMADDDGDTLADCADADCATFPGCGEDDCADGADDDGDTLVDCSDPDCIGDPACVESDCTNNIDDDNDGSTDCLDFDCQGDPACPEAGRCGDGLDNDGDTLTDCDDPDCATDQDCIETGLCTDGVDNDGDGSTDCADADCVADPWCIESGNCSDMRDNDLDGDLDCADADCAAECGPDGDGDGHADVDDCAPANDQVWEIPAVIEDVTIREDVGGAVIAWGSLAVQAGPATVYDVVSGRLSEMRGDRSVDRATCLANDEPGTTFTDPRPSPGPGDAWYYLVRGQNPCGTGSYGTDSLGNPRVVGAGDCR